MNGMQSRAQRAVLVALLIAAGGCKPGGGSSSGGSSSSSSTGGSADLPTYTAFCKAVYASSFCTAPSCAPFDEARCRATYGKWCEDTGAEIDAQVAAGKIVYNAQGSGTCADFSSRYFALYNQYLCGDLDGYNAASLALLGFSYNSTYTLECQDGIPKPYVYTGGSGGFVVCDHLLEGKVANSAACEDSTVCASTYCSGRPDGGCGTCAPPATTSTEGLDEGQTCQEEDDAGTHYLTCKSNLACDSASRKCLSYAGANQPCGAGFKLCAPGCGYQCSGSDGGRGTCVALPSENGRCGYLGDPFDYDFHYCNRGGSCVGATDAGYADLFNATCKPQAAVGAPCSDGYNYDTYQSPGAAGGYSNGALPSCVLGASCSLPDGGVDGVCVTVDAGSITTGSAATGQACSGYATNPCAATGDICNSLGICAQRGALGAPCGGYDNECQAGLWCRAASDGGGNGQCAQPLADGQPCTGRDTCVALSSCHQNVCTPAEQIPWMPLPMCQ